MARPPRFPPPCFAFTRGETVRAEGGRATARFRPTEDMENPYGQIQGGLLVAMLENVMGLAMGSLVHSQPLATVSLSVNFLAPARAGDELLGHAEVLKRGRTQLVVEMRLEDSQGRLLVKATGANLLLAADVPPEPAAAEPPPQEPR